MKTQVTYSDKLSYSTEIQWKVDGLFHFRV